MAWSAPMTAVAGATFSAAQFNTNVRDNLNETAPAKATAAGQIFVSTGASAIAARTPTASVVATSQSTSTTTFTNLSTVGPSVTAFTGTQAIVMFSCELFNSVAASSAIASVDVTGSSSIAASDNWCLARLGTDYIRATTSHLFTGLVSGSNTFTMRYRAGSNTATFVFREIVVFPL
jgi:hypothetical protein